MVINVPIIIYGMAIILIGFVVWDIDKRLLRLEKRLEDENKKN